MRTLLSFAVAATIARAQVPAIATTYAKAYTDSARVHPNARYSPDRMNIAAGWRRLYDDTLILSRGMIRVRVVVTDVMARRFDTARVLHLDLSPRVMRALGMRGRGVVKVTVAQ